MSKVEIVFECDEFVLPLAESPKPITGYGEYRFYGLTEFTVKGRPSYLGLSIRNENLTLVHYKFFEYDIQTIDNGAKIAIIKNQMARSTGDYNDFIAYSDFVRTQSIDSIRFSDLQRVERERRPMSEEQYIRAMALRCNEDFNIRQCFYMENTYLLDKLQKHRQEFISNINSLIDPNVV